MKEMIQARKEQLAKRGKKGFTLMEMLIVVAIIAVLVAIAIPTFLAQLDKARAETDTANIRSGYAAALTQGASGAANATFYLKKDGSVTADSTDSSLYTCAGKGADATGNIGGRIDVGSGTDELNWSSGNKIKYEYTYSTNSIKITAE